METNQDNINNTFTSSDFSKIKSSITKERFLILKEIYNNPGIQPKTLSEKLNKKPNTLSNLINKVNSLELKLIQTDKRGTQHYYSLTDIAKQYVEQELLMDSNETVHSKTAETIISRVEKTLNLLKKECGSNLHFILNDLLNGAKNSAITAEIQKIYNDLSETLYGLRKQNDVILQQIFDDLEDKWLAEQLTDHLNHKFVYFDFLKSLMTSDTLDNIARFKIIDKAFSELHPSIFVSYQYEDLKEPLLPSGEYNNLLLGIIKLSNEFLDNHYSKSTAVMNWRAYFLSEELAFYIAEKCSILMFLHRLIPNP